VTELTTEVRDAGRVRRVLNIIDSSGLRAANLRVLDLASRTGAFISALSDEGMHVTGVEGRVDNIQHILPHPNSTVIHADVRDLLTVAAGPFDVSLCLGILYHLTLPDAVQLLHDLATVTDGLVIVDTHVSQMGISTASLDGVTYSGSFYDEGEAPTLWSSIGNRTSWWFDEPSLLRAMSGAGLTAATIVSGAAYADEPPDRQWFTAWSTP